MACIADLPPEVLELIFITLNLKDIGSCSNVCQKWEKIIANFYKDKAKVLIATGLAVKNGQYTEILDIANPSVKNVLSINTPCQWDSVGFQMNEDLLICGGIKSEDPRRKDDYIKHFFKIGKQRFNRSMATRVPLTQIMHERRAGASSVALDKDTILVAGGCDSINGECIKSTEIVSNNQKPKRGPDLPFLVRGMRMININKSTVIIIGGQDDNSCNFTNSTFIIDPTNNFKMNEGPFMQEARYRHSCGKICINGKIIVVAVGGYESNSVELLDLSSDQGWISGPNLPSQLWDSAIIPSPNGRGVVLLGGIKNVGNGLHVRSDELLELTGESIDSLTWIKLEQKLVFPRSQHIALPVPDTLFKKLPRYAYKENKENIAKKYINDKLIVIRGSITSWKGNYGFITANGDAKKLGNIFLHKTYISYELTGRKKIQTGCKVEVFQLAKDEKHKGYMAVDARLVPATTENNDYSCLFDKMRII